MTHLTFLNHDRCTTSPIAELWLPDISPIARFRYIRLYNQNSCKSEKILLQATATTIVYHQRTVNLLLTALICIRTARVTQIPGCQPMRQVRQPRRYDTLGFSHRRSTCVGPQFVAGWLAVVGVGMIMRWNRQWLTFDTFFSCSFPFLRLATKTLTYPLQLKDKVHR